MFKNLPTSTKLILLCTTFIVSIVVVIYGLVAEKTIAIEFARKELVGLRYLETLHETYAAILSERDGRFLVGEVKFSETGILGALASAEADTGGVLQTAELQRDLAARLELWSTTTDGHIRDAHFLAALAGARKLALRIGDDSNLTLDPDLDSYYLQDTIVSKIPTFLGQLGELKALSSEISAPDSTNDERKVRRLVLHGLIRSTMDGMQANLAAASRRHPGGGPKQVLGADAEAMIASTNSYLRTWSTGAGDGKAQILTVAGLDQDYASAVQSALTAWRAIQVELDKLLRTRIDGLLGKLYRSLLVAGGLASLSIVIALMTHRHIVQPLERLEGVARTVRQTRDYNLRSDYSSQDEIGRLAGAFNDMMSELAVAREREAADQARNAAMHSELARVSRLTTMGEMAASISHEINQPLAAIVANGNAGLRWLAHAAPDLDETQAALKRIVSDGHRASQVIKSIRAMFRKEEREIIALPVNDVIEEVLALLDSDLHSQQVLVEASLDTGLPEVSVDRVQLQQVLLNLIQNAAETMTSITDRPRVLLVKSKLHERESVLVTVADTGPGIDPQHLIRIFEAFFTTKSSGMGLGLSICRSIVEAHGGRLWASAGTPHGSVFSMILPGRAARK